MPCDLTAGLVAVTNQHPFSSLLIGICLVTSIDALDIGQRLVPFSSLLIGICLVTWDWDEASRQCISIFQFPSHRDMPCDTKVRYDCGGFDIFQFPSHRDMPCDLDKISLTLSKNRSFSSLLIGICLVTEKFVLFTGSQVLTFSSLLIGICLVTLLFVRPSFSLLRLSVPFSSGYAL